MNSTMSTGHPAAEPSAEHAFSCALTATLLARVRRIAGDTGVHRLLDQASSHRSIEYLEDVGNWVGFDEAIALWEAGAIITRDPGFARHVGEDAVKVLGASATATMLRALGSPEELLRLTNVSSHRFSIAADLDAVEVRPGYCEVVAKAAPGFMRHRLHCEWTIGMLSQSSALFGLPPARVEHDACQALGAPDCRYYISWDPASVSAEGDAAQVTMLRKQLEAMSERLQSLFATAADLISTGDLQETLARITDRAAQQVRAPQYLLAVRTSPEADLIYHHKGFNDAQARAVAHRVFTEQDNLPDNWCVATVHSHRHEYGRLVAMYAPGSQFLPQERELLELYARYAATALDSATALLEARNRQDEAQRRHEEARTLLDLARRLASAGTSEQIALRLADAVPGVVDCDRVSVYLWDEQSGELQRRAVNSTGQHDEGAGLEVVLPADVEQLQKWLEHPDPEPYFIDMETSAIREPLHEVGAVASVAVPIATAQRFMGSVIVSVRERPERLTPTPELRDRLSGIAAHAVTALENGRLVDHITHQARHDRLTGLANRLAFGERLSDATRKARELDTPLALFYIDLDGFKPVNDELGHEVGDKLLCDVAERLTNSVRSCDSVARLGGDEFAILVDGVEDERQLEAITRRFAQAFEAPFVIDGHDLDVGASIGRAVWPAEVAELDTLLREADAAMYEVKRSRHSRSGGPRR